MSAVSSPPDREAELRATMLAIVADRGLGRVTVREVAAAAGVSIGTVQHYFPTKEAMLAAAFEALVERVRRRLADLDLGPDPAVGLRRVLLELLPVDDVRAAEARVQLAFSAYAATTPALARSQQAVLAELRAGLAEAFAVAGQSPDRATTSAQIALAAVDGLAQHAVSAPGWLDPDELSLALDRVLDALLSGSPAARRAP